MRKYILLLVLMSPYIQAKTVVLTNTTVTQSTSVTIISPPPVTVTTSTSDDNDTTPTSSSGGSTSSTTTTSSTTVPVVGTIGSGSSGSTSSSTTSSGSSSSSTTTTTTPPPNPIVKTTTFSTTFSDNKSIDENAANKKMVFPVTFSKPLPTDVDLKYYINAKTRGFTLGSDIQEQNRRNYLHVPKGSTSANIIINVKDDNIYENDEKFEIALKVPQKYYTYKDGSILYTSSIYHKSYGTIVDDEISITISDYTLFSEDEANTNTLDFNIAFSKPLKEDLDLKYTIKPSSGLVFGQDIVTPSYHIFVPKGSTQATIKMTVLDDTIPEENEYFELTLLQPKGSYGFINKKSMGIILDDDTKIEVPKTGGDYYVYEKGTLDPKLKTKIVNTRAQFDIYASDGFEIYQGKKDKKTKTCNTPACTITTQSDGQKVKSCTTTCYITTKTILTYSDAMDIDEITLRAFKYYDPNTKECSAENSRVIKKNIKLKSGAKYTVDVPTVKSYRCAWLEINGTSEPDVNGTVYHFSGISDPFAIRPDHFEVSLDGKNLINPLVAGKNVTMKISAVDKRSKVVRSYSGSSYKESVVDKYYGNSLNKGLNLNNKSFINGQIINTTSYDEVGELTITVEEDFPAYAQIDKNDNPATYKITPSSFQVRVVPDHFDINFLSNDANPLGEITFLSNDLSSMAANLNYAVVAKSDKNTTTQRYVGGKYADDVSLNLQQQVLSSDVQNLQLKYQDDSSLSVQTKNFSTANPLNFSSVFSSNKFLNGQAVGNLRENFARDYKVAQNPILLTTKNVTAQEVNGIGGYKVTGTSSATSSAHFYYVRAHVPSPQTSDKNFLNAKVYYEVYCKNCDKTTFKNARGKSSIDDLYWYILDSSVVSSMGGACDYTIPPSPNHAIDPSIAVTHLDASTIKVVPPSLPHSNKVFFAPISSDLIYNKYAPSMPTTHSFTVKFSTSSTQWAGEGEKGKTVSTQVSKKSNQSLEW